MNSSSARGVAEIVTIERIGHRGDGIARTADGLLHVPFALPGEIVRVERSGDRGRVVEIVEASEARVAPVCRHFGACGGCALQAMPLDAGRSLKRGFVAAALARQGIRTQVEETVGIAAASRRRAIFTAMKVGRDVLLGYNERLSSRVVDIGECPVLAPALQARIAAIRELIAPLLRLRKATRVTALLTIAGIDLALDGSAVADPTRLSALAERAGASGIARVSIGGEPVVTLVEPVVMVAGVPVVPPPGAFLQASDEAEAVMIALVGGHLAGAKRIADLFCGIGTFTLALARHAHVRAVEANQPALDALGAAVRHRQRLKPVVAERRDLFANPLSPSELAETGGVVFDPPRAGAKAQASALAASDVPFIAAVSCDPASFARDARILIDGGYRLDRVVPIDQFVYSAATEIVGLFSRPAQ